MKELNEEIKLTLDLMQGDIDDGSHSELRYHLVCLLEIKRQRLIETDKPLTVEELKAGGWWCADTSDDALKAFILLGLKDENYEAWDGSYYACFLFESGSNLLDRGHAYHTSDLKQIHRIGNDFYWSKK